MINRKQLLSTLFAVTTACTCIAPATALQNVSSWAQTEVSSAQTAGLEPSSIQKASATAPITRLEFCEIALTLYKAASGKTVPQANTQPFTDTTSTAVTAAVTLGIVSGRGNGIFDPNAPISRQELCKMLDNILLACGQTPATTNSTALTAFSDQSAIATWAKSPMQRMLQADILRGVASTYDDPTGETIRTMLLQPTGTTTREQSLLVALRFYQAYRIEDAPATGDTDATDPEHDSTGDSDSTTTPDTTVPSFFPSTKEEKMSLVFGTNGTFFETPAIAEAAMTEIVIPVWRLKDGQKSQGKAYVTVNRNLAAIYTLIFSEIFAGSEQFPISDVGSYAWRPSPTSEHRWGTAIDINYDANMEATINADGTLTPTTGTHWTPGEDPYSIPEDGDVYRAFTKYGFIWGGNAWRSKRDYMHFSYFGT